MEEEHIKKLFILNSVFEICYKFPSYLIKREHFDTNKCLNLLNNDKFKKFKNYYIKNNNFFELVRVYFLIFYIIKNDIEDINLLNKNIPIKNLINDIDPYSFYKIFKIYNYFCKKYFGKTIKLNNSNLLGGYEEEINEKIFENINYYYNNIEKSNNKYRNKYVFESIFRNIELISNLKEIIKFYKISDVSKNVKIEILNAFKDFKNENDHELIRVLKKKCCSTYKFKFFERFCNLSGEIFSRKDINKYFYNIDFLKKSRGYKCDNINAFLLLNKNDHHNISPNNLFREIKNFYYIHNFYNYYPKTLENTIRLLNNKNSDIIPSNNEKYVENNEHVGKFKLFDHQIEPINYMIAREKKSLNCIYNGGILLSATGNGKTLMMSTVIKYDRNTKKILESFKFNKKYFNKKSFKSLATLIIIPPNIFDQWLKTLKSVNKKFRIIELRDIRNYKKYFIKRKKNKKKLKNTDVILLSAYLYNRLCDSKYIIDKKIDNKYYNITTKIIYNRVVIDEIQIEKINNIRILSYLSKLQSNYKWIITATLPTDTTFLLFLNKFFIKQREIQKKVDINSFIENIVIKKLIYKQSINTQSKNKFGKINFNTFLLKKNKTLQFLNKYGLYNLYNVAYKIIDTDLLKRVIYFNKINNKELINKIYISPDILYLLKAMNSYNDLFSNMYDKYYEEEKILFENNSFFDNKQDINYKNTNINEEQFESVKNNFIDRIKIIIKITKQKIKLTFINLLIYPSSEICQKNLYQLKNIYKYLNVLYQFINHYTFDDFLEERFNNPKIKKITNFLKDRSQKCIIFLYDIKNVDNIKKVLKHNKIKTEVFKGNIYKRNKILNNPDIDVYILSSKHSAEGIDFPQVENIIFFDILGLFGDNNGFTKKSINTRTQCMGRILRVNNKKGKENNFYDFIYQNTVEEKMMKKLINLKLDK